MTNAVNIAQTGTISSSWRNRIINGGMVVSQYNGANSATLTVNGTYSIDRWAAAMPSGQTSKVSLQQNAGSVTPPTGFTNYFGATSLTAYAGSAGDFFSIYQPIEGYNVSDLAWGTASAKTITLSFWIYSSLTGTFGGALQNSARSRSYPFTYSIPTANTWTQISLTIAGDTSGTWVTNNGVGIYVVFGLTVGSTYTGTAGAWAGSNLWSATGAVSVLATNAATFYITGIQFEVGTTTSPFEYRDYGRELIMCQRYFWNCIGLPLGWNMTGQVPGATVRFPVTMRIAPTITSMSFTSSGTSGTPGAGATSTEGVNIYNSANNWGSAQSVSLQFNGLVSSEL
jgi:hypothetical protein